MASSITLKSHRFRTEREQSWRELELILKAIEGRGMKSLSDEQIVALPRLYRPCEKQSRLVLHFHAR